MKIDYFKLDPDKDLLVKAIIMSMEEQNPTTTTSLDSIEKKNGIIETTLTFDGIELNPYLFFKRLKEHIDSELERIEKDYQKRISKESKNAKRYKIDQKLSNLIIELNNLKSTLKMLNE